MAERRGQDSLVGRAPRLGKALSLSCNFTRHARNSFVLLPKTEYSGDLLKPGKGRRRLISVFDDVKEQVVLSVA